MPFELPSDLSGLSAEELAALKATAKEQAKAALDAIKAKDRVTSDDALELNMYAEAAKAINAEELTRNEIETGMLAAEDTLSALLGGPDGAEGDGNAEADDAAADVVTEAEQALTGDLVTASGRGKTPVENVLRSRSLNSSLRNLSLREAQQAKNAQNGTSTRYQTDEELIVTAGAGISGIEANSPLGTLTAMSDALRARARYLPVTTGKYDKIVVASVKKTFDINVDSRMHPDEVEQNIKRLQDPSQLWDNGNITTAGGGWCATPMPTYNFFNLTCEDGAFDAPTFGVERGGFTFPVSPSLADVYTGAFDVTTNPWLWTNTDDVATVTGSPNKPCVRVPCATTTTRTLECYGICLTAGNLTDNAWPEQTRNYLSLLRSAQFHAINARYISTVVSLASTVVTAGAGGAGVISPVLGMVEIAAENYRTRYGMCQNEVLEVVLPHWIIPAMRADATKRNGVDMVGTTDAMIADWFDMRHIRAQFVSDWQVRASGLPGFETVITSWPTTVDFLMYAAGTVLIGNGMTLDLGVVRDSTLNAENDFTAAWMEECHLIARVGHEIAQYRVNICADGTTGANDLTACTF